MLSNKKWDQQISFKNFNPEKLFSFKLEELSRLFNIKINKVYSYLILFKNEPDNELPSYENLEQFITEIFGNKANYEGSCNELRLIDFIDQELSVEEQYYFGMIYVNYLNSRLTLMTDRKIIYLLSFAEGILTIRFHQEWKGEECWSANSLESFSEPVAIYSSDELNTKNVR